MTDVSKARQKARLLQETGSLEQARACLRNIQALYPDDPDIMCDLGTLCLREGDLYHAEEWLSQACSTAPENPLIHFHFANVLRQSQKFDDAIEHYQMVIAIQPNVFEAHLMLASTLMVQKQLEDAEYHFQYAIDLDPGNADFHGNLAQVYELTHRLEDARSACEKALQLNADHIGALMLLGKINSREKQHAEARRLFERVLSLATDDTLIAMTNIELGHVLDQLGQFDNAYKAFENGKSKWAEITADISFDRHEYQKHIADNTRWFTRTSLEVLARSTADARIRPDPVFFVGFPRSGTTLTEQILNQHPDVVTSNESPMLQSAIETHPGVVGYDASSYENILTASSEQLNQLRNTYWEKVAENTPDLQGKSVFIDKLPLNLVHLGFISMLFPDARIIVAIRDPRDVCLSCFMQGFTPNPAMANFFSLKSSVEFYTQVMALWCHYRNVLPLEWYQYRYEDLVYDFDVTTRSLFEFLDLECPVDAGDFHLSAKNRLISTPSYQDVTTPVYHRSVGRWKNYEKYIAPNLVELEPFLESFGYAASSGT